MHDPARPALRGSAPRMEEPRRVGGPAPGRTPLGVRSATRCRRLEGASSERARVRAVYRDVLAVGGGAETAPAEAADHPANSPGAATAPAAVGSRAPTREA